MQYTNATARQDGDSKESGLSMVWLSMSFLHSKRENAKNQNQLAIGICAPSK